MASSRKKDNTDGYTLRQLAELFQEEVRRNRNVKTDDSVFNATTPPENKCPCGLPPKYHRWKPENCSAVEIAVLGKSKSDRTVKASRVKACKDALKQNKWKDLVETVKKSGSGSEKVGDKLDGDIVQMVLNPADFADNNGSVFTTAQSDHPLYNSTIYDPGATTHVVNNSDLLYDLQKADEDDYVLIGDGSLKVVARGKRRMENVLDSKDGKNTRALVISDVAFVPNFHTNVISEDKLEPTGLWYCSKDRTLRMGPVENSYVRCRLSVKYGLKIVEFKPAVRSYFRLPQSSISAFHAYQDMPFQTNSLKKKRRLSRRQPLPRTDTSELWHLRACHASPEVLEHLILQVKGVRIQGPSTVQCTHCATGKATEVISRRESPHRSRQPFYRIFLDIFEFSVAYNGHHYVLLITDEYSGMMFPWSIVSKTEAKDIILDFEARIKRHTGLSICKIRMDNERSLVNLPHQRDSDFQIWAQEQGIDLELPPSHTKEPTGGAERPGGVNQQRMRSVFRSLPQGLWPEVYRAVVWVHNILPSQRNNWSTPKEMIDRWCHQHFRWYRAPNTDFDATRDHRPSWSGIYAYGCRAYPLDPRFKAKKGKNVFKLAPRAHVGYLVGYHASNIYRIWVPKLKKVILSRDVRFNEEEFFDPAQEEHLETVMEYDPPFQALDPLPQHDWDSILDEFLYEFDEQVLDRDRTEDLNSGVDAGTKPSRLQTPQHDDPFNPLPTPRLTPPSARDASLTPQADIGVESQSPGPLLSDVSSAAERTGTEEGDLHDKSEGHDAQTPTSQDPPTQEYRDSKDDIQDTIKVQSYRQPDGTRTADNHPSHAPDGDRRTRHRRTRKEIYGNQPTRKSGREPQPRKERPYDKFINSVFTTMLPPSECPKGNLTTFCSIFLAAASKAARDHRFHRDDLVRLPARYQDLSNHPMGNEFRDAIRTELHNLLKRGTWRLIERSAAQTPPLPLKWIFDYKFDQDGYLRRCKARICVRGDLQEEDGLETYAATLAAKTFRVMMSVSARHDLDIRQFDVGNAFLYSDLKSSQPTYVHLPQGYVELGFLKPGETSTMVAHLKKALYGLRESPLLWYNEISQALKEAGIKRTNEEPCVFTNGKVLILVYVDDILILSPKSEKKAVNDLVQHLRNKYDLREEEFKWYLGIRVIRDRINRKISLCQDAYIDKIARKFKLNDPKLNIPAIPIPPVHFVRNPGQASKEEIKEYQEMVGSIMYVAVMTRPDVARAAAQLARFLTNPAPAHIGAAKLCIRYLFATRFLTIVYDGKHSEEALVIASDASFADDVETRRSSQGYVMMLFNGPVVWKAGLQDTVTTSTTEAELLSLERTAKESYSLNRLLQDISLDLGPLKLYCDNLQTIRLVVEENQRISTRLRHVDIQNMWLKQEFKKGRFQVEYLSSDQMPADGLTKALPRAKFEHFRSMLNMVDIKREVG